jgi:hypothetical protein
MKIALIYSGLPRYILQLHDNHLTHLIPKNVELDTYFHFWDIWGYTKQGWHQTTDSNSHLLSYDDKSNILKKLSPIDFKFESLSTTQQILELFVNQLANNAKGVGSNPRNYIFQFYSLYKSFQLLQREYDVVIRMRTDLQFTNNSPIPFIIDNALHIHNINCWPTINDQMGYGSYNVMKNYHETFLHLENSHIMHPESLLHEQLIRNNVPIQKDWLVDYIIKREE